MSDPVSVFEEALKQYLVDIDMLEDGDIMTGWSFVAECASMNDDGAGVMMSNSPDTGFVRQLGMYQYALGVLNARLNVSIYQDIEDGDDE